uniref:Uncharacterized protein n=1 Tax=Arundo donax TaxID=35708 RepID=A0A0A9AL63_ARUDO
MTSYNVKYVISSRENLLTAC